MRTTIIQLHCDYCGKALKSEQTIVVSYDGAAYEVDCCNACLKQTKAILKDLVSPGRQLNGELEHPRPQQHDTLCTKCGKTFKSVNGLAVHKARSHKEEA